MRASVDEQRRRTFLQRHHGARLARSRDEYDVELDDFLATT